MGGRGRMHLSQLIIEAKPKDWSREIQKPTENYHEATKLSFILIFGELTMKNEEKENVGERNL